MENTQKFIQSNQFKELYALKERNLPGAISALFTFICLFFPIAMVPEISLFRDQFVSINGFTRFSTGIPLAFLLLVLTGSFYVGFRKDFLRIIALITIGLLSWEYISLIYDYSSAENFMKKIVGFKIPNMRSNETALSLLKWGSYLGITGTILLSIISTKSLLIKKKKST